jgi:CDI immunity proteins
MFNGVSNLTRPNDDLTTLDDIEGSRWGDAPTGATRLMFHAHELRRKPVATFDDEDMRLLIGQNISLKILVPLAIAQIEIDPLVEGDLCPGDLLSALFRADETFWSDNPALRNRLMSILSSTSELLPDELQVEYDRFRATT